MERLSILEKIYLYGETLSSEEMNLIVSYVNNTIDAVNALIRNNNGINSGHCEIRYKNTSLQPLKPDTGSNGLSNGWSNTYSLPDTSQGETAWMTLCFISGEDVYGEWSTPVCISWGSVTGLQGPKGDSGETGAFVSRVFKRQNTRPNRPTGGTYDYPYPVEEGWSDGVPDGSAIIWSSVCTFYGNGTSTEWSEPAQESDTATLDIEFSPLTVLPNPPLGNIPFSNHEIEGWYDPNSQNFDSVGTMIWRAERKVSNGEYDGEWTITRIFGEKGDKGLLGEVGGHYEFRYKNYKPTLEAPIPAKPEDHTEGISNGWSKDQNVLSEMLIKEGYVTWMTQCFFNENGYGIWTTPIRITGANGVDGADGIDHEFIYTRNNTGETPYTPPTVQKSEEALFDAFGRWEEPEHHVVWTDDPLGVNDELMWEFVSTRTKQGGLWSAWTTPVVWAKWGKQGKIGPMSYLAGVWKSNITYEKTAEKNPVVYHNNNYYYLKGEITLANPSITSHGLSPTGTYASADENPWARAENFEMVFTDILFVNEFAKLSSFIINHDWMLSKNGTIYYRSGGNTYSYDIDESNSLTINGTTYDANSAYTLFDPNCPDVPNSISGHKNPNFVPAIAIDSLSGRCFFWKGKFTGDVYANSLHLGNKNVDTELNTMNLNIDGKLSSSDVKVISNGVDKTILVGSNTYEVVNGSNFLLTNVGKTSSDGSYFKVDTNGLMEAHNALVYGTVFATAGQFSGEVNATKFIAGDPGGLNITTTGDAISFNYGGERRAWFTTKDPNNNDTGGMYLYLRNPNDPNTFITIDFANLTFKNTSVTGSAIQQTNIYQNYTNSNYNANVFINSSNNLYYSNSLLTNLLNQSNWYEKIKEGRCIIYYNSLYRLYNVNIFNKVSFSSGQKTVVDSNFYCSAKIFGSMNALQGVSGGAGFSASNIYLEDTSNTIAQNSLLSFDNSQNYYYARVGTGGGGKITICKFDGYVGGATVTRDYEIDMHS